MDKYRICLAVLLFMIGAATFAVGAPMTTVQSTTVSTLTVSKAGSGAGLISSNGGTINCGLTCSNSYADGSTITLTATPEIGSQFTGWLGACTGTNSCQFAINGATTVLATFATTTIGTPGLNIDGSSNVDALTDGLLVIRFLFGLNGASLINGAVGSGATRTTATQIGDYLIDIRPILDVDGNGQTDALSDGLLIIRYFFGLRGSALIQGAIGAGATRTTSSSIETQIQQLSAPTVAIYTLSVSKTGNGSGTVISVPAGINCGTTCYQNYNSGSSTALSASANAGSTFSGWGGVCTGTGACNVTMTADRNVVAGFTVNACVPKTCSNFPNACGQLSDGCGGLTANCGSCTAPNSCGGGGVTSQCGAPVACTPKTCSNFPNSCGPHNNGCGGLTANCGSCTAPNTCGGGGIANQCGTGTCTAKTCANYPASCGSWSDGCGGTLSCGSCTSPNTCGGGGVQGQCGASICTPTTCAAYSATCGSWSDGCGGTISCGTCSAPTTCSGGGIPGKCG